MKKKKKTKKDGKNRIAERSYAMPMDMLLAFLCDFILDERPDLDAYFYGPEEN